MSAVVTVFIADDHPVYKVGLAHHLNELDGLSVVGSSEDGIDAVRQVLALAPDVAIVDLKLPRADGLQVVEELQAAHCRTRVMILSAYVDSPTVYRAIASGVAGYLEKGASVEEIATAVRTIANGGTAIAPVVNAALAAEIRTRDRSEAKSPLTERETSILVLAADGLSAAQIARQLNIGQPTVKTHLAHVYAKLDVPDRASAVAKAFRLGLLN